MVKFKEILTGTFLNKVKYVRSTSRSTFIGRLEWLSNTVAVPLIFDISNSFWITGKKANLKHSTCKKSVLLYTPLRTSPLKNCIHQSAHERRNWDQNASILWLPIDFPNKNLKCPAKSSSWFLLRNHCETAIKIFSVPRSNNYNCQIINEKIAYFFWIFILF